MCCTSLHPPSFLLWYLQFCVFSTFLLFGLQNKQVWISWSVRKYDSSDWLKVTSILMWQVWHLTCYVAQVYTAAQLSNESEQFGGLLLSYCKSERMLVGVGFFPAGLTTTFLRKLYLCVCTAETSSSSNTK